MGCLKSVFYWKSKRGIFGVSFKNDKTEKWELYWIITKARFLGISNKDKTWQRLKENENLHENADILSTYVIDWSSSNELFLFWTIENCISVLTQTAFEMGSGPGPESKAPKMCFTRAKNEVLFFRNIERLTSNSVLGK